MNFEGKNIYIWFFIIQKDQIIRENKKTITNNCSRNKTLKNKEAHYLQMETSEWWIWVWDMRDCKWLNKI